MLKNAKKECPFTHEIVSYIYGELGGGSELEFETHLADCVICTDEFAAVSNARFSVYEWQKEEFAHLPTPEIVIPYVSTGAGASEGVGLIAAVRAWLAGVGVPVAVAAGVVVCIAIALLAVNLTGRRDQPVASNIDSPAVAQRTEPPVVEPGTNDPTVKKDIVRTPQPIKAAVNQPRRAVRRSPPDVNQPANDLAVKMPTQAPQVRKAPVLSTYEDNDDSSLRLADLFDEVGG
jgi:hypothetical protein